MSNIINHRIESDGSFSFLFSDQPYWIPDINCSNELLIRQYLKNKEPNLCVIYLLCRISNKNQSNLSLNAQEFQIRQKCAKAFYNPYYTYRFKTVYIVGSVYNSFPKKLLEITSSTMQNDSIVLYRIDRLCRNIVLGIELLQNLYNKGVYIYSVYENLCYHENPIEFIQHIVNANRESKIIGERVKSSLEYKKYRKYDLN